MLNALKTYTRLASGKTENFATYPQEGNFLLKKYATCKGVAGKERIKTRFAQPSCITPLSNTEELVAKALLRKGVYE